jgi:SAM-dependent methyltransferase
MFRAFDVELRRLNIDNPSILELGSGPGFLAAFLLESLPSLRLTLLDFSAAMHDLARARLKDDIGRVSFLERSFKGSGWAKGLGLFDAVITNQAVHELRHKRYAEALHSQVKELLKSSAPYLVCDHYCGDGGMFNDQLYMTPTEQKQALLSAGYAEARLVAQAGSLVMHRAA